MQPLIPSETIIGWHRIGGHGPLQDHLVFSNGGFEIHHLRGAVGKRRPSLERHVVRLIHIHIQIDNRGISGIAALMPIQIADIACL